MLSLTRAKSLLPMLCTLQRFIAKGVAEFLVSVPGVIETPSALLTIDSSSITLKNGLVVLTEFPLYSTLEVGLERQMAGGDGEGAFAKTKKL